MGHIANATTEPEEHEEIEVTAEMLDAGVHELSLCESSDPWEWTAEAIYRAMEMARRRSRLGLPSCTQ
jgi:hypothetical protein